MYDLLRQLSITLGEMTRLYSILDNVRPFPMWRFKENKKQKKPTPQNKSKNKKWVIWPKFLELLFKKNHYFGVGQEIV